MNYLVAYIVYVIAIVAVIFIFNWVHLKLETLRLKHRLLKDLIDRDYETEKIDLNKYLK